MKDFLSKETLEKFKQFCIDNKKYIGVGGVLVCLVLILIGVSASKKGKNGISDTQATEQVKVSVEDFMFDTEYTEDQNDEITTLLQNYYAAYVSADLDALAKIAYPMSDNEKSYLGVVSQYYENVTDMQVHSKAGLEKGTYFVSVENNIKFYGVDTVAPTLDFFYIATDDNGQLYINNIYSNFNRTYEEEQLDAGVIALIAKYTSDSDFGELQNSVQKKYEDAVNSDAKLKDMLDTTLTGAIKQWYSTVRVDKSTEESTEQPAEDQAAADQNAQQDQAAADQNAQQNQAAADQNAQQNQAATDQNAQQDQAAADQNAQQNQAAADQNAQQDQAAADQNAQQQAEPTEYAVQTTDVVNVRLIADPEGKLLGKLAEGVKLTAYGTSGEWTKVSYSGSENGTAYIKTDLLKKVD